MLSTKLLTVQYQPLRTPELSVGEGCRKVAAFRVEVICQLQIPVLPLNETPPTHGKKLRLLAKASPF